jgi:hypothetical protein
MSVPMWQENEVSYLKNLSQNCERLAQRFNTIQAHTKAFQNRIRIPVIVFSSIAGIFSFSSGGFGEDMTKPISLSVGVINIGIAIANSVDSLYGLTDIIQKSSKASVEFIKLKEHIDMELSLPTEKRSSSPEVFIRDSYNEYLSILESCPQVLKNLRWISPNLNNVRHEIESVGTDTGLACFPNKKYKLREEDFRTQPPCPIITISSSDP